MTRADWDACITFCYTADLEAAHRFYAGVLELPMVLDQGTCRIYRIRDGAYLGMCTRADAPAPEGVILTLVCEDVDGACERLAGRGVRFEKGPVRNPDYRIYHAFFRDPAGYLLEIQRFEDPAWAGAGPR